MNTEVPEVPYIIRPRQVHRFAVGLFGALLLIGAAPAVAGAACPKTVTTQAFAAFGDTANYTLVEGGLFESAAPGWSLLNAEVVNESPGGENRGYEHIGDGSRYGQGRSHSLLIDSGGEAVSPAFCVSSEFPSFRFLTRQHGEPRGSLDVSLRWIDGHGRTHETADATLEDGRGWTLSPVLELASKLPAGTTPNVRLVFQPKQGSWAIADVYIDPYRR
jgi:hypothetical protein